MQTQQKTWQDRRDVLDVLDAGRVPWSLQRKCLHCERIAMRGREVCQGHGGRRGVDNPGPDRVQARTLDRMAIAGLLPAALVQLDVWQALVRRPMAVRAPAQMALVLAWSSRDQDPGRWSQVWRAALTAVRDHAAKG